MGFNSKQFQFSDVSVIVLGRELQGFAGVSYKVKTEKTPVFGRGNKALSIQSGNEMIEGKLSLLQSELEAFTLAVKATNPLLKITDVSFDIIVTYGNGTDSRTDKILGCEFTEYEKGMKQGDKNMTIELSFVALDIQ